MKKQTMVEMLKDAGYAESQDAERHACEHVILSKNYEKEVETVWHGTQTQTMKVELFVNLSSGICHAEFWNGGQHSPFKDRWYDTIGKRTFNAVSDTVSYAGFAI